MPPTDNRGVPANDERRRSDADQRSTEPDRKTGGQSPQQRQQPRERYFAPGEDGECH
ncbi:MAG TPA: hypothetical protein VKD22_07720 [Ramlibacter sp.]|nr:hypothetical protein [Ramlibacter sp.]